LASSVIMAPLSAAPRRGCAKFSWQPRADTVDSPLVRAHRDTRSADAESRSSSPQRGQVPAARVVSGAAAAPDALTPDEKARLLAEALGQRPPGGSSRRDLR